MLLQGSRNMRGYDRADEDLDEYEDDYEDDVGEEYEDEEEEEGYEEEEQPLSEDAKKYLDLRQKLKEQFRSKIRKENGIKTRDQLRAAPLEKFGSFFGPSKPAIADRVIQESKSLLETRHLQAKASTSQIDAKKVTVPSTTGSKSVVSNKPPPRQVKTKAQVLKDTRDYSFLLSDEADTPKPKNNSAPVRSSLHKPDARSVQVPAKSKNQTSVHSGRNGLNGYEQKKPSSGIPQKRPAQSAAAQKLNTGNRTSSVLSDSRRQLDPRKQLPPNKQVGSSSGSGAARPAVPKVLPPRKPLPSSGEKRLSVGSMEKKVPGTSQANKTSVVARNSSSIGQRLPGLKPQTSGISNALQHKRDVQRISESRLPKENGVKSKFQAGNTSKQVPVRGNLQREAYVKKQKPAGQSSLQRSAPPSKDPYKKKRRAEEAFSDEEMDYRSEIRKMFGRPTRYADVDDDDDDDCMEVGFDTIMREEMRSARIAKKEDDEEWEKIQEEERRERLRKQAKMRKMSHR